MAERLETEDWQGVNGPLFSILRPIAVASAAAGGVVIFAAAVLVTASVVMRNLGIGGIRGDFESVELACAACASLFLPLCQMNKGHVMVDLFTNWLPDGAQRRLDGIWTFIFALVWGLLCWRLTHGLSEIYSYGDKTMLLRVPVWLVYVPAVFGTGLSAIIAFFMSLPMLSRVFRGLGTV
ncbi:TRAP transporter small permease [Donghicola tyrosinivorans]|uniref:TRAP transporter small permease protein n=1 Tax=Donghicola tyrosinivorans TaxID=1652492 RepID=A0A2T0WM08_9RHOB|nr:TRAP transporter small permease [Donghicola tyrosinivorans]PRY87740.1 TRAP-type C4-dicarboxylate transport system permease small subunit [Donghicola tyrosinivorans]